MRKRDRALVLFEAGEHLQEYLLCQIFLRDAPGEVRTHDADNQGVKMLNKFASRLLIALAHAIEAASQIERQNVVIRHGRMEARTSTSGKTRVARPGYSGG